MGRKKASVFHFLTDKVKKKLQNWANKTLSKSDKCTLLKTAPQAIPNFLMNLFLIPNEVCENIEFQMNGFLWGNGQEGKGVRWKAWDKLCVMKEAGGLGFKRIKNFIISMLAKQGWRPLNNENPKYFLDGDFLTAKLGAYPIYMWRNILEAHGVVKRGCRKRICDGKQTEVWKVPWLPDAENGYMTSDMPVQLEGNKVCNLMQLDQKQWDEEVLMDICNERDINLIRRIHLSIRMENNS